MLQTIIRSFPWLLVSGAVALLVGLAWDAWLHAGDPDLVLREGIFTLANPSHLLLLLGIASVVTGASLFLVGFLSASSSLSRRLLSSALLLLLVALSGAATMTATLGNDDAAMTHRHGEVVAVETQHSHP